MRRGSATEYGLIAALITLVLLAAVYFLAAQVSGMWQAVAAATGGA